VNIPTHEEIEECIKKTKKIKAPGEDGITAEGITDFMHKLISMIWTTEEMAQS
jgi:hypothetical protein